MNAPLFSAMRHIVPFYKIYPGGNPTVLVWETSLFTSSDGAEKRRALAAALMRENHLGAEQVGFLDTSAPWPHLEMMGGEFCVNGLRSAALVFALNGLLPEATCPAAGFSREWRGSVTTSGAAGSVTARVGERAGGAEDYDAAIAAPLPCRDLHAARDMAREEAPGVVVVKLPGITHILVDTKTHPFPESPLAKAAEIRARHATGNEEAVGVIWHTPPDGLSTRAITPVVYVAGTGSSILETACGSGSLALALAAALETGRNSFAVRQPSGLAITVSFAVKSTEKNMLAWVGGPVRLIAEGSAHVFV